MSNGDSLSAEEWADFYDNGSGSENMKRQIAKSATEKCNVNQDCELLLECDLKNVIADKDKLIAELKTERDSLYEVLARICTACKVDLKSLLKDIKNKKGRCQMNKEREYGMIAHIASILGLMCAANPEKIIDLLTGYLFDEEEAGGIKQEINRDK